MKTEYSLPVSSEKQHKLAVGWLYVAVGFLLASGVYPLLLALARTTYEMPWKDFFYIALVLHVDFTVLWWLLAIAAVFWSLNSLGKEKTIPDTMALALVVVGGIFCAIAPLTGASNPLTNNYVPMLENRIFIKGLIIFGSGMFILVVRSLMTTPYAELVSGSAEGALRMGIFTSSLALLIAILALCWSFIELPISDGRAYFESLFWAGGHILQFTHSALIAVSWLWLASICKVNIPLSPKVVTLLFVAGALPILASPWPFIHYVVGDAEFATWFVWLMRDSNGLTPFFIGLLVFWGLMQVKSLPKNSHHLFAALIFSMLLFLVGGVLGLFIGESSTLITAHYHGSIVAVTMAFMAMTYYWLPMFGFASPNLKWATIQVYTYAIGQMLHIIGLAWGGGHGMKRKVIGTTQDIGVQAWITPQDLVGLGGVLAVLSGVLFAIVVLPVMLRGNKQNDSGDEGEHS